MLKNDPALARRTRSACRGNRQQRGSVLVTSQLPIKLWHSQYQDPTLADAVLDRLVHNAEIVELSGESMRKKKHSEATSSPPDG